MKIVLSILIGIAVLLIGTVLIAGPHLRGMLDGLKPKPDTTKVRVEPASTGRLVETVAAPGEIEPHTKVIIYPEVSARIEVLPFDEGDMVRKGDVIARLDDRDLKAALASRAAQREENKFRIESERSRIVGLRTDLEFAQRTLLRQQSLNESGDISLSQLDEAQQRVQVIKSQIDAALHTISVMESSLAVSEANIARAERDLENTIIRSPMDGVITALNVEVGEAVLGMVSNMGTPMMTIADQSRMLMIARVPESDIAHVEEGQTSQIHINAYLDQVFRGVVTKIALSRSSSADGTGFFATEIEIDLRGQTLRSGLNANADIEIKVHEGLRVESQAVVERLLEDLPDELTRDNPLVDRSKRTVNAIYHLVDGHAACALVRPGASDLTHTIVLEGISEGDLVVVGPYKELEKIKHGDAISDPDYDVEAEDAPTQLANDAGVAEAALTGNGTAAITP